jgi:DNA modification methylase
LPTGLVTETPLADLKPAAWNPRTIRDERFRNLCKSIEADREFLYRRPILAMADGTIYAGNMRYRAAAHLGLATVPAILDDIPERLAKERALRDNAQWGDWHEDQLAEMLYGLAASDSDVKLLGIEDDELARLLGLVVADGTDGLTDPDELPENVPTRSNVGDLWLLGEHRVLCGDATSAADVGLVLAGAVPKLVFTSPPYASQRNYGTVIADWDALMKGVFANVPGAADVQLLVNLGLVHRAGEWDAYWGGWIEWMRTQGWRRFGWYVWDQMSGFPGQFGGRCAPSFEFIFHFNQTPTKANKSVATSSAGTTRHGGRMGPDGWVTDYHIDRVNTTGDSKIPDATWRIGRRPDGTIDHPAKFPVALPELAIRTWEGDVYDPVLGSGTTLIACEQLGRKCYGLEIEPKYVDVIIQRWENFTGKTAVLDGSA